MGAIVRMHVNALKTRSCWSLASGDFRPTEAFSRKGSRFTYVQIEQMMPKELNVWPAMTNDAGPAGVAGCEH